MGPSLTGERSVYRATCPVGSGSLPSSSTVWTSTATACTTKRRRDRATWTPRYRKKRRSRLTVAGSCRSAANLCLWVVSTTGRSLVVGASALFLANEDLISLTEDGNPKAFAALYDRHGRVAYSLVYRMMGERQATADLIQEAFRR